MHPVQWGAVCELADTAASASGCDQRLLLFQDRIMWPVPTWVQHDLTIPRLFPVIRGYKRGVCSTELGLLLIPVTITPAIDRRLPFLAVTSSKAGRAFYKNWIA